MAQYRALEAAGERDAIIEMIRARFSERYLDPVDHGGPSRNGFAIMAISCLMIEAMESFRLGWPDTRRRSKQAFNSFFEHWEEFDALRDASDDFYTHVRCGILHQAETTGAWKIRRTGPLWDPATRTINAARFVKALRQVLSAYLLELKGADWNSAVWRRLRKKLDAVCSNAVQSLAGGPPKEQHDAKN